MRGLDTRKPIRASVIITLTAVGLAFAPRVARAQTPVDPSMPQPSPAARPSRSALTRTVVFLGGAASGLGVHEAGHVIFGAAFGADPSVKPIHYGPIPFFAIDHNPVTRKQEFVISSAGLWLQQATSEWLLTARPDLRDQPAPFMKGYLAFHVATSVVYGIAAFAETGPLERDTRGMAASLGTDGVPEPVIGALVIAPGLLDAYRYRHPRTPWAVWASRGVKITGVVLTVWAGRGGR